METNNDKKKNAALDLYDFVGEYKAGICGKSGIQYNVATINAKTIQAMIDKGSDVFVKKPVAEAEPATETYTGSKWNMEALKAEVAKRSSIDATSFTKKSEYQEALVNDDIDNKK